MDPKLILLVLLKMVLPCIMESTVVLDRCGCAVFPVDESDPIIERALQFNVTCDQEGAEMCQQLCVALAEGAKDKGPALICEKLNKHVENLTVAVYTKSCNETWKFTGLKSLEPICCHDGKNVTCNTAVQSTVD